VHIFILQIKQYFVAGAFAQFGIDNKKEIDFVVTTSFNEGLAYEIKMNCRNLNSTSKKKFTENYPGYRFQGVSYTLNDECQWVLKL
jgi:hypothetical protein